MSDEARYPPLIISVGASQGLPIHTDEYRARLVPERIDTFDDVRRVVRALPAIFYGRDGRKLVEEHGLDHLVEVLDPGAPPNAEA